MKGITFNLLEQCVRTEYGEAAWDALLDQAGLSGAYTSLGSYPDDDLCRLVAAATAHLNSTPDEVVRWFGRKALPLMAQNYPSLFEGHAGTRSFLLTLNDIIHPEVRKLYPGADVPTFDFDTSSSEVLRIGYSSPRKLCAFAQGLIEGAAEFFGERVDFMHEKCVHRGDDKCLFSVAFAQAKAA